MAALYQFGGYEQGNGSKGAYEPQVGGDFGAVSVGGVYSKGRDAVALSNYAVDPLPAGVTPNDLKAKLADNASAVILVPSNRCFASSRCCVSGSICSDASCWQWTARGSRRPTIRTSISSEDRWRNSL